jgi:hypothetical protein
VPTLAELIGEADDTRRETQRVMKQDHLGHVIGSLQIPDRAR